MHLDATQHAHNKKYTNSDSMLSRELETKPREPTCNVGSDYISSIFL